MMGPRPIERIDERHQALFESLQSGLPGRRVLDYWLRHYSDHAPQDLADGVVQLISGGEGRYQGGRGHVARRGTQVLILVGYLKVDERDLPRVLGEAEMALAEEIKAWAQTPVPGVGIELVEIITSRQIEHPYGWVVATLEAGPPVSNIN